MARVKSSAFVIGDESVAPGESRVVNLPLPGLYTMQNSLNLAVHVVNGRQGGPRLFVCAAIHGNELNGVEIIRRLLKRKVLRHLRGTLVAIPIVNVFGIVQHSRYLPDGRDLNRTFPGSDHGSLAARLAHTFNESIVQQCTHGIDLHTAGGHRTNLPQIRADLEDPDTRAMARAFGVPVIIHSRLRDGSLRETAGEQGIPLLLYEAGEAMRFDGFSIRTGVDGIIATMRHIGMLPRVRPRRAAVEPYESESSSWVRAPTSGILLNRCALGDEVRAGQVLGSITDPSDCFQDPQHEFHAPFDGIVIGHTRLPLVNEGDALFHVAGFDNAGEVAAELESFQNDSAADPELME